MARDVSAIGGLPSFDSIGAMVRRMDEANVERVFITQTKMWSHWNKWMYMDTTVEEVAQYTRAYPTASSGWPWVEELISVCYKWENVWLGSTPGRRST